MSAINFEGATMLVMQPSFKFQPLQATWKQEIKPSLRHQGSTLDRNPPSSQRAIKEVMSLLAAVKMAQKLMMSLTTSNWKTSPTTGTALGIIR